MTAQHDTRPRKFSFGNIPLFGAGCQLGLSPGGDLLVCASFREVVLIRPSAEEVVHRRRLGGFMDEVFPALGPRWQRLVCTPKGEVLWLRGRRIALIRWSATEFYFLPQDGDCDDIAFDPIGSRLAVVSKSGLIRVWEWHEL
jgi:hypothetical protein